MVREWAELFKISSFFHSSALFLLLVFLCVTLCSQLFFLFLLVQCAVAGFLSAQQWISRQIITNSMPTSRASFFSVTFHVRIHLAQFHRCYSALCCYCLCGIAYLWSIRIFSFYCLPQCGFAAHHRFIAGFFYDHQPGVCACV